MKAMVWKGSGPLVLEVGLSKPEPCEDELLIRVSACAICRTDLHILDHELPTQKLPLIPGHQIVGRVMERGAGCRRFELGQRVGVPWLAWTCGQCRYCRLQKENLCDQALFTGYTVDGGYAEYALAKEDYCFPIPETYSDVEAAPLLCAGLIGFRAYSFVLEAETLGFYGFGAAAHILVQLCRAEGKEVFAFVRPGDEEAKRFALDLGCRWAGDSNQAPPRLLDAALIFAPVGELVPQALRAVRKGGQVICGGIHMSDIPSFPYRLLWEERVLQSVANLTRKDGEEFFRRAAQVKIHTEVKTFPLESANEALQAFRSGRVRGSLVLVP
jgi:propanol-preferring alcohol dehydrogenase